MEKKKELQTIDLEQVGSVTGGCQNCGCTAATGAKLDPRQREAALRQRRQSVVA